MKLQKWLYLTATAVQGQKENARDKRDAAVYEMSSGEPRIHPSFIGKRTDRVDSSPVIPQLTLPDGSPLPLPSLLDFDPDYVRLKMTSNADRYQNRAVTQEDCGQCTMLGVVPEMYKPNPTYGDDATGAACETLATVDGEEFNIPDCMPWAVFDGKILFRLSEYEYTRSRASEACQVMGGYLTIPESQSDHDFISLFLDEFVDDPQDIATDQNSAGFESYIGVLLKPTAGGGGTTLSWEGQQCQFMHLCLAFKNIGVNGLWDDCDTTDQMDRKDCPVPDDYTFDGNAPSDQANPYCAVYDIDQDKSSLFTQFEWYWAEVNCDRKYPALCEIDLEEMDCNMFGFGPSNSPKWRDIGVSDCSAYKHCVKNPATGLAQIELGTCAEGTVFSDLDHACISADQVPSCDVDECDTGHECAAVGGICANTIGSYTCSCEPGYDEVPAPANDVIDPATGVAHGVYHVCGDDDECLDESKYDCVINAVCVNKPGTYACSCAEFFAADGVDANGNPLACIDDDECTDPANCGPNTICTNAVPGYHCPCAWGFYDSAHENPQDELDRHADDSLSEVNRPTTPYTPVDTLGDGSVLVGDVTTCEDVNECEIVGGHNCNADIGESCYNEVPGYYCACAPGMDLNDAGECEDIDECFDVDFICDPNAMCVNDVMDVAKYLAGQMETYTCVCRAGYDTQPFDDTLQYAPCTNINECDDGVGTHLCDDNAICIDNEPVYQGAQDPNIGAPYGLQQDVPYMCQCNEGYIMDITTTQNDPVFGQYEPHTEIYAWQCMDRDECGDVIQEGVDYSEQFCQKDRRDDCTNTIGSFECGCSIGFTHGTTDGCGDDDECLGEGGGYDPLHCNPGLVGDPNFCKHCQTDACVVGVDQRSCLQCYNTVGSYFCGCNVGYQYIGSYGDECTTEIDDETGLPMVDDEGNCVPGVRHLPIEDPQCVIDRDTMDAGTFANTWPEDCGPVCANVYECDVGELTCDAGWTIADEIKTNMPAIDCVDTIGSAYCDCPTGFYSADPAIVIHPEAGPDCDAATGTNCLQAPPGAGLMAPTGDQNANPVDKQCYDINECDYGACEAAHSICHNTVRVEHEGIDADSFDQGYRCECKDGYEQHEVCFGDAYPDNPLCIPGCVPDCVEDETIDPDCTADEAEVVAETMTQEAFDIAWPLGCDNCINGCIQCGSELYPSGCSEGCINEPGNPDFNDRPGDYNHFAPHLCMKICLDIDECADGTICPTSATGTNSCTNVDGEVTCECGDGYTMNFEEVVTQYGDNLNQEETVINYISCDDINECDQDNECHEHAECENIDGGYICTCPSVCDVNDENCQGFLDISDIPNGARPGSTCLDIDECLQKTADCDPDATTNQGVACINTVGSFACQCKDGFLPNDVKITDNDSSPESYCDDIPECEDNIDTCMKDAHEDLTSFPGTICTNPVESDYDNIDDEYNPNMHDCELKATCTNTLGSFLCECNFPYAGDGQLSCQDANECFNGQSDCPTADTFTNDNYPAANFDHPASECVNQPYFYLCQCTTGFMPLPEIPECVTERETIMPTDQATFMANWPTGCASTCDTIDLVAMGYSPSEAAEYAGKTPHKGGLWCDDFTYTTPAVSETTASGDTIEIAEQVHSFACVDIDECANSQVDFCAAEADCNNNSGGYDCVCKEGYSGDGRTDGANLGCSNINECTEGGHNCKEDGTTVCIDLEGSFMCQCNAGYCDITGDGADPEEQICSDCDECTLETHFCNGLADCSNTIGSFDCACRAGYEGTGFREDCTNIDECTQAMHNCDVRAACADTDGSFECLCLPGFEGQRDDGNGVMIDPAGTIDDPCIDTDECAEETHNCLVTAQCLNNDGGFDCKCNVGYYGSGKLPDSQDPNDCEAGTGAPGVPVEGEQNIVTCCHDINECAVEIALCGLLATCDNTEGSFTCTCDDQEGYELNAAADDCEDIDECSDPCANGSTLPDGRPCPTCDLANGDCLNVPGGYMCQCKEGYDDKNLDGTQCDEIDECQDVSLFICQEFSSCINLPFTLNTGPGATGGIGYECECDGGYRETVIAGVGNVCTDIDECTELDVNGDAQHDCEPNADCENGEGTYTCTCKAGTSGVGTNSDVCVDTDECADPNLNDCHENANCDNKDFPTEAELYTCECKEGYTGNGVQCFNENECNDGTHDCCTDVGCQCNDEDGTFSCECIDGFEGDGLEAGDKCTNIIECQTGDHNCDTDNHAYCIDKNGGFVCACEPGFEGDGVKTDATPVAGTSCTDMDNCQYCPGGASEDASLCVCGADATCQETPGSYECVCDTAGYFSNGADCFDENECLAGTHLCDENAVCTNLDGSHECTCIQGFRDLGAALVGECEDINECDLDPCIANADCSNEPAGSFTCTCKTGYALFEDQCLDIDECAQKDGSADKHECPPNSHCVNTEATYECECDEGYQENGPFVDPASYECSNIDECAADPCPPNSQCEDKIPEVDGVTHVCNCDTGYIKSADQTVCLDEDECDLTCPGVNCVCDNQTQDCNNTPGAFTCTCKDGYEDAGGTGVCVDIDECLSSATCQDNAICVNDVPGFSCVCNEGYREIPAGVQDVNAVCDDIDECVPCQEPRDNQLCPCGNDVIGNVNEICMNTAGSYECWCPLGWWMKADECVDVDECSDPEYLEYMAAQGYKVNAESANATGHFMDDVRKRRALLDDDFFFRPWEQNGGWEMQKELNNNKWKGQPGHRTGEEACGPNTNCLNLEWGYDCECAEGYEANPQATGDQIECVDIDECSPLLNFCPDQVTGVDCTNSPGTFSCSCQNGYEASFNGTFIDVCEDVDECVASPELCGSNTACTNNVGGFECQCMSGFTATEPIGASGCSDIDECTLGTHLCDGSGFPMVCTNTPGGYECAVDPVALADGNARDIWDWYFELADRMSNETTANGNSWPADQMNLTHYLDGRLVPTQAPIDGSGTFDAQGLVQNPPGGTGSTINGGTATTQAPTGVNPGATQDPSGINNPTGSTPVGPGGPGLASMQGDPHVIVNTRGEIPICFDVVASDHRFVDLLSDKVSGIEINAEMHTDDHSSRMIAIGVRYEVMGGSGNVYKLMTDENGVTVWVNDEPNHSFGYGDINGDVDVGGNYEFIISHFGGKKPGVTVTCMGVASLQITYKDRGHKLSDPGIYIKDYHSMGFNMIDTDGISHLASGILGHFIIPHAYRTGKAEKTGNNFVNYHGRTIPTHQRKIHKDMYCNEIDIADVPTLMGTPVQNFEVKTMFTQGDDEKMEDLWLKMLQNHEFIRNGNSVAVNYNL